MEQPKWYNYMYPILKILSDGNTRGRNELKEMSARFLKLTPELMAERLPNSPDTFRFSDRAGWALTYLKQSGLIATPTKRGQYTITDEGKKILKEKEQSKTIVEEDLERYPSYLEFVNRHKEKKNKEKDVSFTDTPDERLGKAEEEIKAKVCADLLERVMELEPDDFERLAIKILVKMGYASESIDIEKARIGGAGDNGIDGVINQDKLGLDIVYIQAKRYTDHNVSPKEVRDFVGAVSAIGKGSKKGVFFTTSDFTNEGREFAEEKSSVAKIVLINGKRLSELMYEHNIGVSTKKVIEIKEFDADYFDSED